MQTAVLLFLLAKVIGVENNMSTADNEDDITPVGNVSGARSMGATSIESLSYPNEIRLREIIREELSAHLTAGSGPAYEEQSAIAVEAEYTAEDQYKLDAVMQKLDYFESVGSISEIEMQDIQMDIARLHKADQKRILSRLTRAMNTGGLKGRL